MALLFPCRQCGGAPGTTVYDLSLWMNCIGEFVTVEYVASVHAIECRACSRQSATVHKGSAAVS